MYTCYVHPYSTYLAELHNVVNWGENGKGFWFSLPVRGVSLMLVCLCMSTDTLFNTGCADNCSSDGDIFGGRRVGVVWMSSERGVYSETTTDEVLSWVVGRWTTFLAGGGGVES